MELTENYYREMIKKDGQYWGRLVCPSPKRPVATLELQDIKTFEWVYWYGDEAMVVWDNWY